MSIAYYHGKYAIPRKRLEAWTGKQLCHCVVLFFCCFGIIDCMLFTVEYRVLLMRYGATVVCHLLLPLMNSFYKTEAAVFPMQAMLP